MTTPILEARGLVKRYGHVTALAGSDFDLMPGEILAVIGDNGAGKSSLIKALAGAVQPDHGEIRLAGEVVHFKNPMEARSAGIETVYQNLALSPALSIADNLFLGRRRAVGVDAQFELGPFELWSEYLRGTFEPASRIPNGRFRSDGWYAQAGYFVIPDKLQLVERLEVFDPSYAAAGDATRSSVSGLNWYFKQHDLKLQLDWMRSRVPGASKEQQKIIARLQTVF